MAGAKSRAPEDRAYDDARRDFLSWARIREDLNDRGGYPLVTLPNGYVWGRIGRAIKLGLA